MRIFNFLPEKIKKWNRTQDSFKELLDKFLERIPHNPITETLTPEARYLYDKASILAASALANSTKGKGNVMY